MVAEYRYAGPDGEGIADLPDRVGAAVGSEYCVHLMPGPEALAGAIAATRERRVPLLLLTPYFRDAELKRTMPLFRSIPTEADVEVVVNDWGVLFSLRTLLPGVRLSLGRLLSGQKRCPRIGISGQLTARGRTWHGEGIFSSGRAREHLEKDFGIRGYHLDILEWRPVPGGECPGREGSRTPVFFVHGPHAIVTVSDSCPWLEGRSSADVPTCHRPCRRGTVTLTEPTMGEEMVLRGKVRFVRTGDPREPAGRLPASCRTVYYAEIP